LPPIATLVQVGPAQDLIHAINSPSGAPELTQFTAAAN
jgi:hypothetical protein